MPELKKRNPNVPKSTENRSPIHYLPRTPGEGATKVWAMQVQKPYKAVAEFCGGKIQKDGPYFSHIALRGSIHLAVGDYVVREPSGMFVRRTAQEFEDQFLRAPVQPQYPYVAGR